MQEVSPSATKVGEPHLDLTGIKDWARSLDCFASSFRDGGFSPEHRVLEAHKTQGWNGTYPNERLSAACKTFGAGCDKKHRLVLRDPSQAAVNARAVLVRLPCSAKAVSCRP